MDYFDVIKNPMDFARIRNKINGYEYNTASQIINDIRLIFANCALYNKPATIVAMAGESLGKFFESRLYELNLADNGLGMLDAGDASLSSRGAKNNRKRTM